MPVDTKHPDYKDNEAIWEKCEDFHDGEEKVKAAGIKYLPKLSGQTNVKYNAYKDRAPFFGGVARTVSALVGAIFRKEPAITLPPKIQYLINDATGTGMSLPELAITLTVEIMKTGRASILLDRPVDGGRPYLTVFDADDLINWNQAEGNSFVVLEDDKLEIDPDDKFNLVEKEGYRELTYDINGNYIVNIWDKITNSTEYNISKTITPLKNGKPIQYIPFCCISPTGLDFQVDRPPILDMVNVLNAWWKVSADHANAVHVICVPTPVIIGVSKEEFGELELGPDTAIILPDPGSSAIYLEFKGQGLDAVSSHLDRLMDMLGALGARLVTSTGGKTLIETAEGARLREASSTAILGSIVASVEAALAKTLRWAAEWENDNPDLVKVKLNRELVSTPMDANMLTAMLTAVIKGNLSFNTFYHNLEEAGLSQPGVSVEDEKLRIKDNPVGLVPPIVPITPNMPDTNPPSMM